MALYRFVRNTDRLREGAAFRAGEVVEFSDAAARHWLVRGAMRPHTPVVEPVAEAVVETVDVVETAVDDKPKPKKVKPEAK